MEYKGHVYVRLFVLKWWGHLMIFTYVTVNTVEKTQDPPMQPIFLLLMQV